MLGLFSCQENLSNSLIMDNVDYFLTDSILSNAHINEMFAYGYVQNYVRSHRVVDSFDIARIGPIFGQTQIQGLNYLKGYPD